MTTLNVQNTNNIYKCRRRSVSHSGQQSTHIVYVNQHYISQNKCTIVVRIEDKMCVGMLQQISSFSTYVTANRWQTHERARVWKWSKHFEQQQQQQHINRHSKMNVLSEISQIMFSPTFNRYQLGHQKQNRNKKKPREEATTTKQPY